MRPKNSTFDTYTWIHEQLNNQELRKQQKNLLLSKEDYILWLEEFTSKYPIFSDTDWLYNSTDLEEKDQENINQISLLYEIIDTYAKANYLYPNSNQFICYYYLKVKQNYYQIGQSIIKPQPIYYCQKMNFPLKDAIDFTTIQKNEVNKKTLHIEKKLQDFEETLEELLLTLKDEDVPNQAIKQKTKKILHKVLKK